MPLLKVSHSQFELIIISFNTSFSKMYDDIISPKSSAFINTFILEKSYVVESLKIFTKKMQPRIEKEQNTATGL